MLARVRDRIEPSLVAAGFDFAGRNKPEAPAYLYLDYSRDTELIRVAWDRRDSNNFIGFVAELARESVMVWSITRDLSHIARTLGNQATAQVQFEIEAFAKAVNDYLESIAP